MRMSLAKRLTRERLEKLYVKEHMPVKQICEEFGIKTSTLYKYLKKFGIHRKSSPPTKEHRKNISEALRGRKISWGDKISEALTGKKRGKESIKKQSMSLKTYYKTHDPWNKGKKLPPLTEGHKLKISKALEGKIVSKKARENMSKAHMGKHYSPETEFKRGHEPYFTFTDEIRRKAAEARRTFYLSKEKLAHLYNVEGLSANKIGKAFNVHPKTVRYWMNKYDIKIRSNSQSTKLCWLEDNYVKNQKIGRNIKPNKPEKAMIKLVEEHHLPFKYVGDLAITIGGLNPDFISIDGTKKIIEVFGRAFHDPAVSFINVPWQRQYWGRKAYFSQLGYDCLIVWDDELGDEAKIVERLKTFIVAEQHLKLYGELV